MVQLWIVWGWRRQDLQTLRTRPSTRRFQTSGQSSPQQPHAKGHWGNRELLWLFPSTWDVTCSALGTCAANTWPLLAHRDGTGQEGQGQQEGEEPPAHLPPETVAHEELEGVAERRQTSFSRSHRRRANQCRGVPVSMRTASRVSDPIYDKEGPGREKGAWRWPGEELFPLVLSALGLAFISLARQSYNITEFMPWVLRRSSAHQPGLESTTKEHGYLGKTNRSTQKRSCWRRSRLWPVLGAEPPRKEKGIFVGHATHPNLGSKGKERHGCWGSRCPSLWSSPPVSRQAPSFHHLSSTGNPKGISGWKHPFLPSAQMEPSALSNNLDKAADSSHMTAKGHQVNEISVKNKYTTDFLMLKKTCGYNNQ